MKVVLDTNVLIAAILTRGRAHHLVVDLGLEGKRFEIVTSQDQIEEFKRVIQKKFPKVKNKVLIGRFIRQFKQASQVVTPERVHLSPDPDDDAIIGTLLAAKADYLVTRDKSDLLSLKKVHNIPVVSVTWLLKKLDPYGL